MAAVADKLLTLEEFRQKYAACKPYFEYWNGRAIQKAMPTKLHARLQGIIRDMLMELGYEALTELTLRIDPNWEPIPDVSAVLEPFPGDYPTKPVDVVVEILSPGDEFSFIQEKCERYGDLGIADILILDPVRRKAWFWNRQMHSVMSLSADSEYALQGRGILRIEQAWNRLRSKP